MRCADCPNKRASAADGLLLEQLAERARITAGDRLHFIALFMSQVVWAIAEGKLIHPLTAARRAEAIIGRTTGTREVHA